MTKHTFPNKDELIVHDIWKYNTRIAAIDTSSQEIYVI